ncbi:MAG: acyl carrier protein [Muribaculaceae bacterium]|nr:acyl carrier protein [Muribaculaceae bacterium]MDE6134782.1 acyl carrier protein [Muribaculaceae bacterium]
MGKKCNNCGFFDNPDNAKYCGKCGITLSETLKELNLERESNPNVQKIARQIVKIVNTDYDDLLTEKPINESAPLSSLDIDSMDFAELLLMLEEKFGVTISEERAMTWCNIFDAAEYISSEGGSPGNTQ